MLFWLMTILISFFFFRKAIKIILNDDDTKTHNVGLEFKHIAILIGVILIPIINFIASIGFYIFIKKEESDYDDNEEEFLIRILRKMFFIRKKK